MATKTKRFLSGHDVFAEYIPDYERIDESESTTFATPKDDADDTVKRLLDDFKSKISSKKKSGA